LTRDALFEDFEKDNTSKAIDNFESALIAAYERALESGLAPGAALAAMLDWISSEFARGSLSSPTPLTPSLSPWETESGRAR